MSISSFIYLYSGDGDLCRDFLGIKKTQKTPPSEIERAKNYRTEYLSREEKQK